jgi:hypothetical protein
MEATLVILAAGLSTRYGRLKQLEPVGPGGESLLDYGLFDAHRAGFSSFVFVVREELEPAFREWGRRHWPQGWDVAYAHQSLDDLPQGCCAPEGREKPWGTGHAILSARERLSGPFGVINADDFYGASSYRILYEHLTSVDEDRRSPPTPEWGLVGYRLGDTLSEHGGVSRGICRVSEDGFLREIQEVHKIDFSPEGGGDSGRLSGVTEAGEPLLLTGDEVISRNLWSFSREFLGLLEDLFLHFLEEMGTRLDSEFLIPAAVATMLERGDARVRVLSATDLSFGMTHPADLDGVKRKLKVLTAEGAYSTPLFAPRARQP